MWLCSSPTVSTACNVFAGYTLIRIIAVLRTCIKTWDKERATWTQAITLPAITLLWVSFPIVYMLNSFDNLPASSSSSWLVTMDACNKMIFLVCTSLLMRGMATRASERALALKLATMTNRHAAVLDFDELLQFQRKCVSLRSRRGVVQVLSIS
jgi:bacteriorhodopsin